MKKKLSKIILERYSRQIILKNIGVLGQQKLINSKILIVGIGGLGSPILDLLARSGIGKIGIIDHDKIDISNLHRQTLFNEKDINKFKVKAAKKKIKNINNKTTIKTYNTKANEKLLNIIVKNYDILIDGSDNFKTKFLLNKLAIKFRKKLIVGAISKFDGHIFTFDFSLSKTPCLKCFYQNEPSDEILNCESEGRLGTTSNIIGALQANEAIKMILNINKNLNSNILIIDLLNLNFRKVLFKKRKNCLCKKN